MAIAGVMPGWREQPRLFDPSTSRFPSLTRIRRCFADLRLPTFPPDRHLSGGTQLIGSDAGAGDYRRRHGAEGNDRAILVSAGKC